MSAAEKGEIEYSGLELAIIQSLREGERATLSVLMISGSDGVSGDTRVDVHLKDGVLQWLTMPMSRLERMRRDSGGLAAVVMRAVRVWLVASPLISLVPRPTGPSTHSHLSGRSLNNESVPGSRFPSRECTDLRGCPTVRLRSSTARPIRSCNARTLPRAAYSRQSRTSYTCKVPCTSRLHPVYIPLPSFQSRFNRSPLRLLHGHHHSFTSTRTTRTTPSLLCSGARCARSITPSFQPKHRRLVAIEDWWLVITNQSSIIISHCRRQPSSPSAAPSSTRGS